MNTKMLCTSIDKRSSHAKVHAAVAQLSPVKKSKSSRTSYFDGTLTDGNSHIRTVGFDTKMHQQMDKFYKDKETVTISNCEIRPSKVDDELEIIVKSSSGLQRSATKFQIPDDITGLYSIQCITIEHVEELPIFKKISITAKAVLVSDQEQVYNGKAKQDVKLADTTGSICLVLWESDVGKLQQGVSYRSLSICALSFII